MSNDVITELYASPTRRFLGVGMLFLLGGILLYTGLAYPPASFGWQAFLLGMAGVCLWMADRMRQATAHGVQLTEDGLRSSDGEIIAAFDDIHSVDRGMFVFKPSHGFVVRLKTAPGWRWMPGLWWRMGKRIGIGGVTPGGAGKVMADMLAAMLLKRDKGEDGFFG